MPTDLEQHLPRFAEALDREAPAISVDEILNRGTVEVDVDRLERPASDQVPRVTVLPWGEAMPGDGENGEREASIELVPSAGRPPTRRRVGLRFALVGGGGRGVGRRSRVDRADRRRSRPCRRAAIDVPHPAAAHDPRSAADDPRSVADHSSGPGEFRRRVDRADLGWDVAAVDARGGACRPGARRRRRPRLHVAGRPATVRGRPVDRRNVDQIELVDRFLREVLGWEAYMFNPAGKARPATVMYDGALTDQRYLRCAPGRTNPLYPPGPELGIARRVVRADARRPPLRVGEPRSRPARPPRP